MEKRITVKSRQAAWDMVKNYISCEYELEADSKERAGYPIYRSSEEYYDYICDLGCRLEVNLKNGNISINIWIEDKPQGEEQGADIEVTATVKSGEQRVYETYAEFMKDYRFFLSSGKRFECDEEHFEKIINSLRAIDEDDFQITTIRSGVSITFTFKRWR